MEIIKTFSRDLRFVVLIIYCTENSRVMARVDPCRRLEKFILIVLMSRHIMSTVQVKRCRFLDSFVFVLNLEITLGVTLRQIFLLIVSLLEFCLV